MKIIFNPNFEVEEPLKRHFIGYLSKHKEVDCVIAGASADFTQYFACLIKDGALFQKTGNWKAVPIDWVCCKEDKVNEVKEIFENE
jgi:hypothetical protein